MPDHPKDNPDHSAERPKKSTQTKEENFSIEDPLKEGIDFYLDDNGLMVFTAHFLKKRGYCCKSGCRHCPYSNK